METSVQEPVVDIQPIEEYLSTIICEDKLALYQPILDLLMLNEQFSHLDALNLIIEKTDDQGAVAKLDLIHETFHEILTAVIKQFDVITTGGDLSLLTKIYHALTLLDVYEESTHIVNICNDDSLDQTDKLYQLISLVHKVDDQEFYNCVQVTALSLIDKVKEIHTVLAEQKEEQEYCPVDIEVKRVELIRAAAVLHPELLMIKLIKSHAIVPNMSVDNLTTIIRPYFGEYESTDNKTIARELLTLYLMTSTPLDQLTTVVKQQLPILISDDILIMNINAALSSIYVEISGYVKA